MSVAEVADPRNCEAGRDFEEVRTRERLGPPRQAAHARARHSPGVDDVHKPRRRPPSGRREAQNCYECPGPVSVAAVESALGLVGLTAVVVDLALEGGAGSEVEEQADFVAGGGQVAVAEDVVDTVEGADTGLKRRRQGAAAPCLQGSSAWSRVSPRCRLRLEARGCRPRARRRDVHAGQQDVHDPGRAEAASRSPAPPATSRPAPG